MIWGQAHGGGGADRLLGQRDEPHASLFRPECRFALGLIELRLYPNKHGDLWQNLRFCTLIIEMTLILGCHGCLEQDLSFQSQLLGGFPLESSGHRRKHVGSAGR